MKPVIAITIGDFNGIGPEVALKAAMHGSTRRICRPLLVGPLDVFEHVRGQLKIKTKLEKAAAIIPEKAVLPIIDVGDGLGADVEPGAVSKAAGKSAGLAIETAVKLCLEGRARAMVTAPVSKEALHLAGYNFPGQTEMVALFSRSQRVAMMLVTKAMRVALVTIHIPVRAVAERISKEKLVEKAEIVFESLQRDFLVEHPRLAVLGLNPHAGEHGVIGAEEEDILIPALKEIRTKGINVEGPFAADAFFGQKKYEEFDAVLAMYHDQGLIPLKMTSFGKGVNFSAGLPVIRTSPDHGTAYDIAGKGTASIESMLEAIKLSVQLANTRHD